MRQLVNLAFTLLLTGTLLAQEDDSPGTSGMGSGQSLDSQIAQATDAIQSDPGDVSSYIVRGRLYFAKGDYSDAADDFSQALQRDPNNHAALFQHARSKFRGGDPDAAIADYDQFLQLKPDSVPAYVNRGAAYLRERKLDQAIADESVAIKLASNNVVALLDRARAYQLMGNYDAAIADETQVLQLAPSQAGAYVGRGIDHGLKGEYAEARSDFNQALTINPDLPPAYNNLAWQMATCPDPSFRDGAKAIGDAMKACELWRWMAPGPVDTLAAAYAESGDFDSAVKWEQKFLEYSLNDAVRKKGEYHLSLYQEHQPYHREDEVKDGADDGT